jgi:archaemetzincin
MYEPLGNDRLRRAQRRRIRLAFCNISEGEAVAIEVVIHPFEKIAGKLLDAIRAAIKERFGLRAAIGEELAVPAQAYSGERRQYLSTLFLDLLVDRVCGENQILLGVTAVDLYTPDLNFMFGEASSAGRVAVFSLARLYSMTGAEAERRRRPKNRIVEFDRLDSPLRGGHKLGL